MYINALISTKSTFILELNIDVVCENLFTYFRNN